MNLPSSVPPMMLAKAIKEIAIGLTIHLPFLIIANCYPPV
jgi:hypothetical protein